MPSGKDTKKKAKQGTVVPQPGKKDIKGFFSKKNVSEKEILKRKEEARAKEQSIPEDAPPAYTFLEDPTPPSNASLGNRFKWLMLTAS